MQIPVVKQINDLLWALHRWEERRWLRRRVGRWERRRAMGRSRFVWRYAIGWGLSMDIFWSLRDYFAEGHFSLAVSIMMIPIGVAFGWWGAAATWAQCERLYERAKRGDQ
jgi:hypothetical protein